MRALIVVAALAVAGNILSRLVAKRRRQAVMLTEMTAAIKFSLKLGNLYPKLGIAISLVLGLRT